MAVDGATGDDVLGYPDQAALARQAPDPLIVCDGEGRVLWGNGAAERLFGLPLSEGVGRDALDFVHPDDVGVVANAFVSVQAKDVGTPIEVRVRSSEGWRLVEVVGANLLDDPAVGGIALSLRDLTERRRWEVARDEVSRFRALVQNASTIIALLDEDGTVQSVSAAVTRLLGHDQEQVEGFALSELVAEEDRPALAAALARAGRGGSRAQTERLPVRMKALGDPYPVPFELHIVDLVDDPTVNGVVVSAHDVSDLHRSMAELAAAQAELARKERLAAVGRLASMVGHELRNPLTAITHAHFLIRCRLEGAMDPEVDQQLTVAERETQRALRLAQDLNDYVRPRRPSPVPLTVASVVEELLEATPPPPGVSVEAALDTFTLTADREHLRQMLTNLVVNAYEALAAGGTVRISSRRTAWHAEIAVQDDGPGIDAAIVHQLFEPFVTTKARGSGLGLAIVQRLAEEHGGTVILEAGPQGGTVATVRLPVGQPGPSTITTVSSVRT